MPTSAELAALGKRSLFAAGVSATAVRRLRLYDTAALDVALPAGSEVRFRVDPGGCHLVVTPGLEVIGAGALPDLTLTRARYDFRSTRFEADVAGLSGALAEPLLELFLNRSVRPRLPAALRRAGYSLDRDPDLAATLRELTGALSLGGGVPGGAGGGASLSSARELAVFLQLKLDADVSFPLEGLDALEVFVPRGAILSAWIRTSGPLGDPALRRLEVEAPARGVVLRSTGGGLAALAALEVRRVTVYPGPAFAFEYELLLEQLAEGALLLGRFAEVLAGRFAPAATPEVRLRGLRTMIDAALTEGFGAFVAALLARYDAVIPAVSLRALLRA
ncbi:MAG: hypothetical protein M5U28_30780 [Sandaracinaceae bacterium]|nr:hypothetical protein [Sandaracinaceae bacterium]